MTAYEHDLEEEVIQWLIEVWNEPNLCGFWENADMQEYFKLFHRTFDAIKEVNPDRGYDYDRVVSLKA